MAETNSLIRVGVVSDIDNTRLRARVYYPDLSNMVSDWLFVLQRPYLVSNPVSINENEGHRHTSYFGLRKWMPKIDDKVLVIHTYGSNTDGYIVGVIP